MEGAIGTVRVWTKHAPLEEAAHRRLMELLSTRAEGEEALLAYEHFWSTLRSELGTEPSSQMRKLAEQLREEVEGRASLGANLAYSAATTATATSPLLLKVPFAGRYEEFGTLVSSISLSGGMGSSISIEGAADGAALLLYVEHFLCPALERGQVVVMDNLQVHKMKKVRELIEGRGCSLVFLPSYSPDFNPIEEAFSKVKGLLRKAKARTFEVLVQATGRALSAVTEEDARGFFTHCGYGKSQVLSL